MLKNESIKTITVKYLSALLLIFVSISSHADERYLIPESDVDLLRRNLLSAEMNIRKETLVKLQWAGISDERVFDPIVERIQTGNKIAPKYAKIYVNALIYSGNPKYLTFLTNLSQDAKSSKEFRKLAKKHIPEFDHYQSISAQMNDSDSAASSEEFWAKRYEKGLRVTDKVRMRWAARDLYLSGFNESSYSVARTFLAENYKTDKDDSYFIDTLSFLCKALGLSRDTKNKDILIEVANNTPNKKLAKYAERSTQYFDPGFKSTNAVLKSVND